MKVCPKCKIEKDESAFYKAQRRPDGLAFWCKTCAAEHARTHNQRPEVKEKNKQNRHFPMPGTKIICRDCLVEKEENLFDLNPRTLTGRSYQCKDCRSLYNKRRLFAKTGREARVPLTKEERRKRQTEAARVYRAEHREEVNRRAREGNKARRKVDPGFAIKTQLTNRLGDAVRNGQKAGSGVRDLGCTIEELKAHLESKFQPGMTWDNRGHGYGKWNIDHIMPLAAFDLTNRQHVVLACHYLNLQPLWHEDNMSKGDKLDFRL